MSRVINLSQLEQFVKRLVMYRFLGYERVYLPLYKVADTPFHIQGDGMSFYSFSHKFTHVFISNIYSFSNLGITKYILQIICILNIQFISATLSRKSPITFNLQLTVLVI